MGSFERGVVVVTPADHDVEVRCPTMNPVNVQEKKASVNIIL